MAKKKDQRGRERRKAKKLRRREVRAIRSKSNKGKEPSAEPEGFESLEDEVPEGDGPGMVSGMRGLIRGDLNQTGGNFITRRRTLGEWAIILGVISGAVYLYLRFVA